MVKREYYARNCCLKFTVKFTLPVWYIIGKKHESLYLYLYIRKTQTQIF
jgi:hypothetical protein